MEESKLHQLSTRFNLSYTHRIPGDKSSASNNDYNESIKPLGSFTTIEEFWGLYSFCKRPNDLEAVTDYHLFRDGIKPMWEDDSNAKGGKCILRVKKGLASRLWEFLVLAVIGEQFGSLGSEICGIVVSVRYHEDILSLWTRTDQQITRIQELMKKILSLPAVAAIEYKSHNQSLQDRSSFRNTDVVK